MKPSLQISIPEPCTQLWDNMAQVSCGRYCTQCSKQVTDLTAHTDAQLYHFFSAQKEDVCIRVLRSQVGRAIASPMPQRSSLYRFTMALGLTIMLAQAPTGTAWARAPWAHEFVVQDTVASAGDKTATVSGYVTADGSSKPLVATVSIFTGPECVATTQTNAAGDFSIPIPPGRYTIQMVSAGYDMMKQEVEVSAHHNTFVAAVLKVQVATLISTQRVPGLSPQQWDYPLSGTSVMQYNRNVMPVTQPRYLIGRKLNIIKKTKKVKRK